MLLLLLLASSSCLYIAAAADDDDDAYMDSYMGYTCRMGGESTYYSMDLGNIEDIVKSCVLNRDDWSSFWAMCLVPSF